MDFRCANCLASQWIDRVEPLRRSDALECSYCGMMHEANPVPALGSTEGSHYRHTFDFANAVQIDMPSAYSVLLQLVTLNELREAQRNAGPDPAENEPTESSQHALFPDLTDEELGLLERLTSEKPDLLERIDADDVEQAQDTIFTDLSEAELGLLDGMFLACTSATASGSEPDSETRTAATPDAGTSQSPLLLDIDPGFSRAVEKGHLTVEEALRRGSRIAYTRRMTERHRLPLRLAYAVADNRITLHKALLYRDAAEKRRQPAPPAARERVRGRIAALVIGVAATMVGLAAWGLWSRNFEPAQLEIRPAQATTQPAQSDVSPEPAPTSEPPTRRQALRSATAVLTDEMGRITQVTGPDPGNVLQAFCEKTTGSEFIEPIEVTETVPPSREARLGVFRDLQSLDANQAIRIRRDRQSRRWVAGDGVHPIQVMQQPDLPPGAFRTSVTAH